MNELKWDQEIDALVVGSGFAGLTAAIEAKTMGKNVVVIEKMKKAGGNSIISDGGIAAPNTALQAKHKVNDSEALMYEDMFKAGLHMNQPELLSEVVKGSKEAFEWTINELGVPYMDRVDIFGGHSVPRCYTPEGKSGATIIKKMLSKLKALNIPIWYSTSLKAIHLEEGSVHRVELLTDYDYKTNKGVLKTVKVNKGLVLAAGGYGADVEFRQLQDPRLDNHIQTTNKTVTTAEVIKAAKDVGAAVVHMSQIQLGAWASPDEKGFGQGPLFADYILFQYGIIVDPKTGSRFVNELGDRKRMADAMLEIGHPCIGIADLCAVEVSGWNLEKAIKKGVVKKFDSVSDIAEGYGIDSKALEKTVEKYNSYIQSGIDSDYGKPIVENSKPIGSPPYHCMRLWPKIHYTMGGIRINKHGQVINESDKVINKLYAAGEIVGGIHGASRLGSCAVTDCIVFGRIVGKKL